MASIGLLLHQERAQARELASQVVEWLHERGHEVRLLADDAQQCELVDLGVEEHEFSTGLDLALCLGGDGSMLRAVDLVASDDVPVMGVNVGHLGYLTELEPADVRIALKRFLSGSYDVEERMRLAVRVEWGTAGRAAREPVEVTALNEAVLDRTRSGHTVRLGVTLEGEFFTWYVADGLIVSTPTGSTAYAFSARGPIVDPTHRATILVPVSPHMLFDRTLVLDPGTEIRVEVEGHRSANLSIDGREIGRLDDGDAVVCSASPQPARLVTFGRRDFHRTLKAKFGLSDR